MISKRGSPTRSDIEYLINPPRDLIPREASNIQEKMKNRVIRKNVLPRPLKFIAGLDSAYSGNKTFSAAAVLQYRTMRLMELSTVEREAFFRYLPGLLAFREAPTLMVVVKQLRTKTDVFIVDGHGYAHPRRFGLACHVGVALDAPVIGVAKSLLVGSIKGSCIVDGGEVIGVQLTCRSGKNLYVSVGHKVSLRDAVRIVQRCTLDSNPEPIKYAHREANLLKRKSL